MNLRGKTIALVGPLPPPSGGMANQTAQLARLLRIDGAAVILVQTNRPTQPAWLAGIRGLRALLRLAPYLWALWRAAGAADLLHVMANSGWSWHLYAAPAIWIGHWRGKPVVLNYRGGEAAPFLARQRWLVAPSLKRVAALVAPSSFLQRIFAASGFDATIIPNIIDLQRFTPGVPDNGRRNGPVLLVARNLEAIYDNATALRAFALVRAEFPGATLTIAGTGPELPALLSLAAGLNLGLAVTFTGRVDNGDMPALYRGCDLVLNPSLADNMPISVLEALACGLPLVSTNVGGIPAMLEHESDSLLVAPGDAPAMAQAVLLLLRDPAAARRLAATGRRMVARYSWDEIGPRWRSLYQRLLAAPAPSGYTRLVSALLFPLHEKLKRHDSARLRKSMEASQWWDAAGLQRHQLQRLRALLAHAQAHVPYYRKQFARSGFDPAALVSLADLARLPLLDKGQISANRDDFRSELARDLQHFNTGGSSGEPLVFYIGRERISHDVAAKWRATRWWQVDIGDREVVVWGSPIELSAQDRLRKWRDRMLRTTLLPAFVMTPGTLDGFIAQIRALRPKMLFGYPSALAHIARHAQTTGAALDQLGIKVAFVTSERLYDQQRAVIGAAFGCPVANGYGGRDAGFIAHECPSGGMHITAEDIIVEIVDQQGRPVAAGDSGSIVITHLATRDFPFIRYQTGDVGALDPEPCACGRGLPLLQRIEGRSTDFLVAHNGTVMHGLALVYIVRDLPQVRAFKIIQESLTLTRVLLVALPALDGATRRSIEAGFKARLGLAVSIVIDEVAAITPEASGKYRYVVSKVVPPPGDSR